MLNRGELTDDQLIGFYRSLLLPRVIEEKMLIYLRQGKISKWFSGWGQEAVSVGCALAMTSDEYILTMHRNLGVFTTRQIPLRRLFAQFQGKENGFTNGRDRSFHFGSREHRIVGMISHLGPQLGIADGLALSERMDCSGRSTLVFTGDGGASEGDFHEALNVAAVWDLPVIFAVENNQWGLSTPSSEQFRCRQFTDKGIGYGMEAMQVNGNSLLEVYHAVQRIRIEQQQRPRPFLLECHTFRMRGHEEASGTKYYPEGLQDQWKAYDPVDNLEAELIREAILQPAEAHRIREELTAHVASEFELALAEPHLAYDEEKEKADLFAPYELKPEAPGSATAQVRYVDAISNALDLAMERHRNLVLMGQDIAEYGGVFKVTEGLVGKYGKVRVRNTPLCESAIVGAALGLSIGGKKAVVEMQFSDFVTCGFNQIVNNLAKIHWRWGQNADVVVRMPTGANVAAGPFHSQSTEAWFFHTPGLRILYPAFADDAKGLLLAAIEDPNPVLFFEHKYLYRSRTDSVPEGYYTVPIGKARQVSLGTDLSIITYGLGVHWALEAAERNPGLSVDIVDLRSLSPLDWEAVYASVKRTGRVILLHEDVLTGGVGAELAARIASHCFEHLDAPVTRCASSDTPVPFASVLEQGFLASSRLQECMDTLMKY